MAKMVDATDLKSVGTSRAGSIPAERTKFRKGSKIERVYKLHKQGCRYRQIIEITGFAPSLVNSYLWKIKNPDRAKELTKKHSKQRGSKFWKEYYAKNREARKIANNNWYHNSNYWYRVKCKKAGVTPL